MSSADGKHNLDSLMELNSVYVGNEMSVYAGVACKAVEEIYWYEDYG
jgi:hypothetical protein